MNISLRDYVAVLIDADNVTLSYIEQALKLADYYGRLEICKAYGDWNSQILSPKSEKIDDLNIHRVQVDRIGKNATDHRLLIEAGEILGNDSWGNQVSIFIVISGDGDFASACQLIRERGKRVIVIGNSKKTSKELRETGNEFYPLEDLDNELARLEAQFPLTPTEYREFYNLLFFAYIKLTDKRFGWVACEQLDTKLRELDADFENKFGKFKLSECLKSFDHLFEMNEQMIRQIDLDPQDTILGLMLNAYHQVMQPHSRVHLGQFGKALRELDPDYETRFGNKKLSQWLQDFPRAFRIDNNYVLLGPFDESNLAR